MRKNKRKIVKAFIWVLFIIYCLASIYVLFLIRGNNRDILEAGNIGYLSKEHFDLYSNFVPFHSVRQYLEGYANGSINTNIVIVNLLGNILWFAPLGLFIPMLFGKKIRNFRRFLLTMVIILLLVEILQFLSLRGSMDIDDIILNLAGACAFYCLTKIPAVKNLINAIR